MKNLSLWEVTDETDLSRFRIRKNRPAANTALLRLLANNDYQTAYSVAKEIEDGRFSSAAEHGAGDGGNSLSGVKALVLSWFRQGKGRRRRKAKLGDNKSRRE